MCFIYHLTYDPNLIKAVNHSTLANRMRDKLARPLTTDGVIRPTDIVPVIAPSQAGSPQIFPMVWGFSGPNPLFSAMVETANQKPALKEAWLSHRCAIPASWYYDWKRLTSTNGKKTFGEKMLIQPRGLERFYLAGLYRTEEAAGIKFPAFIVLTIASSPSVIGIHDRMPLIFPAFDQWIDKPDIQTALTEMVIEPAPPE